MRDLPSVIEALRGHLSEARVVRDREIHGSVKAGGALRLAQALRADFGAELRLMVGNDRRGDIGALEVYYLFAHPTENWFLHARKMLAAEAPTVASLGIFHHPASLFEQEMYDLFGITPTNHPDPRPLVRHGFWPADFFPLRKDARAGDFADDGRPRPEDARVSPP